MGLGDNRSTPKMRRKISQAHKKARIKRRRELAAKERAAAKAPAPAATPTKKQPKTAAPST